ncbi:MAG: hypothetical protein IJ087_01870 [Eggerthellaceae bacterium]|nr:hypothetical protein [Eggerthellaceae bacterium]
MKTCPVCHATTFDDAEICYGCMHRYTEADEALSLPGAPPEFRIRFTPARDQAGSLTWTCAVEV